MRPTTWKFYLQIDAHGEVSWTLARALYGRNGQQKWQQLAHGYVEEWSQLPKLLDQTADMIQMAYELGDGALQLPLPV